MLYKLLSALSSLFVSQGIVLLCQIGREQRLVTQEWTPERTAALITWWNEGICASEIGRRLSVTKNAVIGKAFRLPAAEAPAVISDAVGRPERRPTGATGSGNVQLATGRDRRKRLSLLWLGGRPETLLPYALQTGVPTGSQKPQGCCGRLILGRERKPDLAISGRVDFIFPEVVGRPPVIHDGSVDAVALMTCSTGRPISAPFCSSLWAMLYAANETMKDRWCSGYDLVAVHRPVCTLEGLFSCN